MPWYHRTLQIGDRPGGVLIDDSFRHRAPIRELPRLAWFGVFCRLDPGSGFCHPEETEQLDAIEGDLIRLCSEHGHGWAVYVMRIDTRGLREYFIYNGESATLDRALPGLQALHPDYRIEFDQKADAEWLRYRTFLPEESLPN